MPLDLAAKLTSNAGLFFTCKSYRDVDADTFATVALAHLHDTLVDRLSREFLQASKEIVWDEDSCAPALYYAYGTLYTFKDMITTALGLSKFQSLAADVSERIMRHRACPIDIQAWSKHCTSVFFECMPTSCKHYATRSLQFDILRRACHIGRIDIVHDAADRMGHDEFVQFWGPDLHAMIEQGLKGDTFLSSIRFFVCTLQWNRFANIAFDTDTSTFLDIPRFQALCEYGTPMVTLLRQWVRDSYSNDRVVPSVDMTMLAVTAMDRVDAGMCFLLTNVALRCSAHRAAIPVLMRRLGSDNALLMTLRNMYSMSFMDVPRAHTLVACGVPTMDLFDVLSNTPVAAYWLADVEQDMARIARLLLNMTSNIDLVCWKANERALKMFQLGNEYRCRIVKYLRTVSRHRNFL
jgi:hypothetical protein